MPDSQGIESSQALKREASQNPEILRSFSPNKRPKKTNRTSAYDPAFQRHLQDHGIHLRQQDKDKPVNFEDLQRVLMQPRPSLSLSQFDDAEYETFSGNIEDATTEADLLQSVFLTILGHRKVPSSYNVEFNNLAPLTDGTITKCKPDYYEGSCPADLNESIRQDLAQQILPSTNTDRACLPNFFVELKGPNGNATVARRQACYDGAIGARAMYQLQKYASEDAPIDNNAYTITSTFYVVSGEAYLTLYTMHPTASQGADRDVDYKMTRLNSYVMTGNIESFRQGATAIRNLREWAQQQRAEAIGLANTMASRSGSSGSRNRDA